MDIAFHYPPELFQLLVDTIPLLCRSKQDTVLFLRGAGVPEELLHDIAERVRLHRSEISKFEIVRTLLTRINERSESLLRVRREIIKRVVEYDDFSACWDTDRLKAQGLVAQIQKLVGVKDSFTRMQAERDKERQENIKRHEDEIAKVNQFKGTIAAIKSDLFRLFAESDPRKRGIALEDVLNRLFEAYGISIRSSFTVRGADGEGVIEQVDGVIELNGHLYFVEMKWWKSPVGVPEISQHMVRIFGRAESRAIVISASEYTAAAVSQCKELLALKVVTLCTLQELVLVLERHVPLNKFLQKKIDTTIIDKTPFPKIAIE